MVFVRMSFCSINQIVGQNLVLIHRWSLFTGGLYSQVVCIAFDTITSVLRVRVASYPDKWWPVSYIAPLCRLNSIGNKTLVPNVLFFICNLSNGNYLIYHIRKIKENQTPSLIVIGPDIEKETTKNIGK